MTSKKTKEDIKVDDEPTLNFDVEKALTNLIKPKMFKAGLKYYIESENLEPSSQKEFEKIVNNFSKIKMGG